MSSRRRREHARQRARKERARSCKAGMSVADVMKAVAVLKQNNVEPMDGYYTVRLSRFYDWLARRLRYRNRKGY